MKYRAAIFDFDGTLVDTLDDLADSMNHALADLDLPTHPREAYRYFVGQGMRNLVRATAPSADGTTLAMLLARMVEHYQHNWHTKSQPYRGISETVASLQKKGLRLAVLSNKPDDFTKIMTRYFFLDDPFDIVRGEIEGTPRKPDPVGALLIASELEIEPKEFLYLGDTNTDMRTGLAAGMFTIGVTWGFRPRQELEEAGAQAIIDRPEEVAAFL